MKVVGHHAVGEHFDRIESPTQPQEISKSLKVLILVEDVLLPVATVEDVVDETISEGAGDSRHVQLGSHSAWSIAHRVGNSEKVIFTTHSHREVGCSFETRRTLREISSWRIGRYRFSMNSRAFVQGNLFLTEGFCLSVPLRQTKKSSLCELCDSVVKK